MVGSRTLTAVVGLVASLVVSVVVWYYFNTFLLFLFVPFVPILLRRGETRELPPVGECPACGFTTRDLAYDYLNQGESPAVHGVDETRSVSFAHQNAKRSGDGRESDNCGATADTAQSGVSKSFAAWSNMPSHVRPCSFLI